MEPLNLVPGSNPRPASHRGVLVVVGNGMVGHRFCEKLREADTGNLYQVIVLGEEPRPAYDRLHLTDWFKVRSADKLALGTREWYAERGIELRTSSKVTAIHRGQKQVETADGQRIAYDTLVLATGSSAFVPPIPGANLPGVFVYRTIEDLEGIAKAAGAAKRAAVIGGGLLGLEAARAVKEMDVETHVLEMAPRLMPRQLDGAGGALLAESIKDLGVELHLACQIARFRGDGYVDAVEFADGTSLPVDMVVISAGIKPRDELARASGIEVGPRGGVTVDNQLRTSDPDIFAIGEVALHKGVIYGLVAPGYEMAAAVASTLTGAPAAFEGGDLSAKLKLLGVDVASFGDPFANAEGVRALAYEDQVRRQYKKVLVDTKTKRLVGGILVGDAKDYARLQYLSRSGSPLSDSLDELGLAPGAAAQPMALPDDAQVCSCNNVTAGQLRCCVRDENIATLDGLKKTTKAGTGCGGCVPVVTDILNIQLKSMGVSVRPRLCEHFDYTRQDLFQIVASKGIRTFADLLASHGSGDGCEICKPTVASILASLWNEPILKKQHRSLQDSNDRFLANIQKDGTYSVIPRIPGGEITPDKLVVIGRVAEKFGLHTKITGGQRVDMLGAKLESLPTIWRELVDAGFESGHAYGKALRTVKSCVGSNWCRFGVQDSTSMAIRLEERYKGIRAPHKLKSAVSGCIRECAEAQGKDFGLIATEKGWNIYVCGNGGSHPRHAEMLATDVDGDTAIRYLDRFIIFYIRTADRLTRTSVWLEKMEGGIERLREIIVKDALGIAADLEKDMRHLVDTYECEWAGVLKDPERLAHFSEHAKGGEKTTAKKAAGFAYYRMAKVSEIPEDGGLAAKHGDLEIAIFHFASRGEWYATENSCPHKNQNVLARGILGGAGGTPKVACPLHKNAFDLKTGACLTSDLPAIATYKVKIEGDDVLVELPPARAALHPQSLMKEKKRTASPALEARDV